MHFLSLISQQTLRDIITQFLFYGECLNCREVCAKMKHYFDKFRLHELELYYLSNHFKFLLFGDISRIHTFSLINQDAKCPTDTYAFFITFLKRFHLKNIDVFVRDQNLYIAILHLLSTKNKYLEHITFSVPHSMKIFNHFYNFFYSLKNLKSLKFYETKLPVYFFSQIAILTQLKTLDLQSIDFDGTTTNATIILNFQKFPTLEELRLITEYKIQFVGSENHICLKKYEGKLHRISLCSNLCSNIEHLICVSIQIKQEEKIRYLPKLTNLSTMALYFETDGLYPKLLPELVSILYNFVKNGGILREDELYHFGLCATLEENIWHVTSDVICEPMENDKAVKFLQGLQEIYPAEIKVTATSKEMQKALENLKSDYLSIDFECVAYDQFSP